MSGREHRYAVTVAWTGNRGTGTSGYKDYGRDHDIRADGKDSVIVGSADPAFRGDAECWNPEDLLVGSLAACHKLWFLHLCAEAGIVVTGYTDNAEGVMEETGGGSGRFRSVTLRPHATVAPGTDIDRARDLHAVAHEKCFIANSVNFPVGLEPSFAVQDSA